MVLCVNGRPCEDLAPLRHIMAERKREKPMQIFIDRRVAILLYVTEAHLPIPPDVLNTRGVNEPCMFNFPYYVSHKTSAFGIHE